MRHKRPLRTSSTTPFWSPDYDPNRTARQEGGDEKARHMTQAAMRVAPVDPDGVERTALPTATIHEAAGEASSVEREARLSRHVGLREQVRARRFRIELLVAAAGLFFLFGAWLKPWAAGGSSAIPTPPPVQGVDGATSGTQDQPQGAGQIVPDVPQQAPQDAPALSTPGPAGTGFRFITGYWRWTSSGDPAPPHP